MLSLRRNLICGVLLTVAMAGASCTNGSLKQESQRSSMGEVPDVLGLRLTEACEALSDAGFEVRISGVKNEEDCHDRAAVTNQSPEPGTQAGKEAPVTLTVSPTKDVP